ncbi:MAG: hypothetical protein CMG46_06555 [Candidatus Marinimicrobia bacterium]|nr:hypothetical protein [Candidatus Neomarinimicrobiota bacterium]
MRINTLITSICLLVALTTTSLVAADTTESIAVIGTGEVGSTLGKRWADKGHRIIYGSRMPKTDRVAKLVSETGGGAIATTPSIAAQQADIVLLAVPWSAYKDTVESLGDLGNKVIIDPINYYKPVGGYPGPLDGPSIAQQVQALLPEAKVVKAFNTLGSEIMADPKLAAGPVTIPLAGNDREAKARIAALARDAGLEPMDMGPLSVSVFIEGMLGLYVSYRQYNPGKGFEFYLRPMPDIINSGR